LQSGGKKDGWLASMFSNGHNERQRTCLN